MLYAATDAADPDHGSAVETLAGWPGEIVVSAFTAAEADHLILSRLGLDAELAFIHDLALAYNLQALAPKELLAAGDVCRRYRDLKLGLAGASLVVLARRFRTRELATFDERRFRAVEPLDGGAFRLHPADSG